MVAEFFNAALVDSHFLVLLFQVQRIKSVFITANIGANSRDDDMKHVVNLITIFRLDFVWLSTLRFNLSPYIRWTLKCANTIVFFKSTIHI